ncbi:MAG: hypothetical protein WCI00_07195 [bacterium]
MRPAKLTGEEKIAVLAKPNLSLFTTFLATVPRTVFLGAVNTVHLNRLGLTY